MTVKILVRDGEPLAQALKRFRDMVRRHGPPGTGQKRPKWHKNQVTYFLKHCERRRRDALRDEFTTFVEECSRRELSIPIPRGTKRRKQHFGDLPVVVYLSPNEKRLRRASPRRD